MSLQPKSDFSFATRSSIHIGGACEAYFPENEQELLTLVDDLYTKGIAFKVIGRASNVLARDTKIQTKVIFTECLDEESRIPGGIRLQTGVRLSRVIYNEAKMNRSLCPELIGVPGSVGGMIYQNASCYGRELSECFVSARVYDLKQRRILSLDADQMQFGYRTSILKKEALVLLDSDLCFLNEPSDPLCTIREVTQKRKRTVPEAASLGSVFMKNAGCSIGMLLDCLSQKGRRFGGIAVSERHAGILVNVSNGTCEDYLLAVSALSDLIYKNYGFMPRLEIEFIE